jgi:hypothetical protein
MTGEWQTMEVANGLFKGYRLGLSLAASFLSDAVVGVWKKTRHALGSRICVVRFVLKVEKTP